MSDTRGKAILNAMPDRPNILFIMADQFRFDHLGYMGSDFVRTPNLDRLAVRGLVFTHCCTNAPVCAPARIGLATGLQPAHVGSLDNHSFLPNGVTTYYQRLRDAGYRVGCVGKLDLAKPDAYNGVEGRRPLTYRWGFTDPLECEGKQHAGRGPHPHDQPHGPYTAWLKERGLLKTFQEDYMRRRKGHPSNTVDSALPTEAFEDVWIGDRAADWLGHITDEYPWHYFVSFVGPHNPFDPPTEFADHFRHAAMPDPIAARPEEIEASGWKCPPVDPDIVVTSRRQYCASIEAIDTAVGKMMQALEQRGILDNTYVVFSSDHGEMLGDFGRFHKSVPYESALRVPLFVTGPRIESGRSDRLIELNDINPTICELAGLPTQESIDARSFAPALFGREMKARTEIVSALRGFRLIRTATHKYIENVNLPHELYDLADDPEEHRNIVDEKNALRDGLAHRLAARFVERHCQPAGSIQG